jgi:hypothetical protein
MRDGVPDLVVTVEDQSRRRRQGCHKVERSGDARPPDRCEGGDGPDEEVSRALEKRKGRLAAALPCSGVAGSYMPPPGCTTPLTVSVYGAY